MLVLRAAGVCAGFLGSSSSHRRELDVESCDGWRKFENSNSEIQRLSVDARIGTCQQSEGRAVGRLQQNGLKIAIIRCMPACNVLERFLLIKKRNHEITDRRLLV